MEHPWFKEYMAKEIAEAEASKGIGEGYFRGAGR
jgi:hypothetical protein